MKKIPFFTFSIAAAAILIAKFSSIASLLDLQRSAIGGGEYWRLITCHLTHFDTDHLIWDVAALLILGGIAESESRRETVFTAGIGAAVIGIGVLLFQPQFQIYRGLSGIDSALFGLVMARLCFEGWRNRHIFPVAVAVVGSIGFTLKCLFELASGETVFAQSTSYAPVPFAHLLGVAVGIAVAAIGGVKRGRVLHFALGESWRPRGPSISSPKT
jgi:rhomboid family GlyGly-CTERM serine protease